MKELFVIGISEDVEAEYGAASEKPVTMLSLYDGEIYCCEGFATIESAKNNAMLGGVERNQMLII